MNIKPIVGFAALALAAVASGPAAFYPMSAPAPTLASSFHAAPAPAVKTVVRTMPAPTSVAKPAAVCSMPEDFYNWTYRAESKSVDVIRTEYDTNCFPTGTPVVAGYLTFSGGIWSEFYYPTPISTTIIPIPQNGVAVPGALHPITNENQAKQIVVEFDASRLAQ